MPTNSRLPAAVKRIATRWAGMLTSIAKEFAPNHIAPYIKSRTGDLGEGIATITVSVDVRANPLPKYGTLDARAQEFGSGERASSINNPRADHQKIPIYPKNRRFLAFHWEVADQNPERFKFLPDGRVLMSHVESPGIHPYKGVGYLRPAIEELRYKGKTDLDADIRNAITGDIREMFRHAE